MQRAKGCCQCDKPAYQPGLGANPRAGIRKARRIDHPPRATIRIIILGQNQTIPATVEPSVRIGLLPTMNMKTFSKTFAVIAILWAVFSLPLLSVLTAANGVRPMTRLARSSATELRRVLPNEPLTDTTVVTIQAQGVSNSAVALDWAVDAIHKILALHTIYAAVSSVAVIILSILVLRTNKRDASTAT